MTRKRTRILIVDDEEIVRESLSAWLEKDGYTVATAPDGSTAIELMRTSHWSILLVDLRMPRLDGLSVVEESRKLQPDAVAVIMTAYASVDTAVTAMKSGAYDYLVKPFDPEELSLMIEKIVRQQALVRENALLRKALKREFCLGDLVGRSPAMQAVFEVARSAARSQFPLLISGEAGTGKGVLARAIHAEGPRCGGPFIRVSCEALSGALLETELFGSETAPPGGAAVTSTGRFEAARGGTLLLDEIGVIAPSLQRDLLRTLEEGAIFHTGGSEPAAIDTRIMASTSHDIPSAVGQGTFREDLFRRLNVIPLHLPPLRERLEDIPPLVDHLIERLSIEAGRRVGGVTAQALALLIAHRWPGNVGELKAVLRRGVAVAAGNIIEAEDLGLTPAHARPAGEDALASLEEIEHRHIAAVLHETAGNISQAARVLGIDRATLYSKMKKFHLDRHGELDLDGETDQR